MKISSDRLRWNWNLLWRCKILNRHEEKLSHAWGLCYRCNTVIHSGNPVIDLLHAKIRILVRINVVLAAIAFFLALWCMFLGITGLMDLW